MGPKKGGKGGGAAHELDQSQFIRQGVDYSTVEGETAALETLLSGNLSVVSKLFPEWNIEGESWSTEIPAEELLTTAYPSYITTTGDPVPVKVHLGLEAEAPADPKAKGKKDAKKGAPATDELTEPEKDEEGNPLPRMFIPAKDAKNRYTWNFRRKWEPHQQTLNAELEVIKGEVSEATQKVADASEDEEAKSKLEAAQAKETAFMDANGLTIAAATGDYFDPCLVEALNLIFRFGPAVIKAGGGNFDNAESGVDFPEGVRSLWENIYPKLPDGRPMYNPAGKYAVRLFLGGAWRMVKVNDAVPCAENNVPALQGSAEPLELWPTIISKALYAVFTACGYMQTMRDILPTQGKSDEEPGVSVEDAVKARRTATYTSFVVHLLTGWLPSTPWSISGLLTKNGPALKTLVEQMVAGGAPLIDRMDIPSGPILVQDEEEGSVASRATDLDGNPVLKTKKQFKELYAKARAEKEHMLSIIGSREIKVSALDEAINSISKEPFGLCYLDSDGKPCVVPVLAVSYSEAGHKDLGNAQLLIDWYKQSGLVVRVDGANISEQTPVHMTWISLNALMAKNAFLFSFDSNTVNTNVAVLHAGWEAAVEEDAGGKGKKGKGAEPAADPKLTERGVLPPTLLSLARKAPPPLPKEGDNAAGEEASVAPEASDENKAEAETELREPSEDVSGSISLSIVLQADLPKVAPVPEGEGAEESAEAVPLVSPGLVDGAVLVLTEARFDAQPPLVLRVEMDKDSELPLSRATVQVPRQGLYGTADKPALFWVTLHTRGSLQVYFSSDMQVSVGPAEEVWESLGYHAKVHEGTAEATPAATEQQFCEISVSVPVPPPVEGEGEAEAEAEEKKGDVDMTRAPALCAFHVPSATLAANLSLVHAIAHYNHKSAVDDSLVLPRLSPNLLHMTEVGTVSRLVGRCYPLKADAPVPAFSWKAVFLCEKPLDTDSRDMTFDKKRYSGTYAPNKDLTVFEDVLSIDKTSFPFSFRLNLAPLAPAPPADVPEGEEAPPTPQADSALEETLKGTVVSVTLYRKSDNKKIHKYTGRRLLSAYSVPITGFLEDGEEPPAAAPADPKGKGKGKDGGGSGCEIVVKCTVDAALMAVPDDWRSLLPYMFYGADAKPQTGSPAEAADEAKESTPLHDVPAVSPKFSWSLDILAGSALSMTHDFRRLEKAVDEKNEWGASDDSRAERAAAATAYLTNKLRAQALLREGADVKAEVFEHLSKAIQQELPQAKVLESIVMDPPGFREAVYGPAAASRPYTPAGDLLETASAASLQSMDVTTTTVPKLISDPYKDRGFRNREQKRVDAENEAAFETYLKFKDTKRQQKTDRVEVLLKQAEGIETLFQWDGREKQRKYAEQRNSSLSALLERSTQARSDAKDIEEGKDPKKGKKK